MLPKVSHFFGSMSDTTKTLIWTGLAGSAVLGALALLNGVTRRDAGAAGHARRLAFADQLQRQHRAARDAEDPFRQHRHDGYGSFGT